MAATLSLRQALSQAAQLAAKGSFWDGPPGPGRLGPWSTLILGGQVFPGADGPDDPRACAVRLKGAVRYRIDSQKVKGGSGHKLVTEGYDPTQLTAEVRMWRNEQWLAFIAFLPFINPKVQGNLRRSFSAEHPYLAAYGISSVYINEIHMPEEGEHRMIRVVRLNLWEVFDLKTEGSGGGAKTVQQADSSEAVADEFQDLESTKYEETP